MNWIDRNAVLLRLRVKPQTLYAYVSRGFITARPHPDDPRSSLYSEADIRVLEKRRRSGRGREAIAKGAIAWGDPVMETAITTVKNAKLIYRGEDAVKLARDATLEDIAACLWKTHSVKPGVRAQPVVSVSETGKARAFAYLAARAAEDMPIDRPTPELLAAQGQDLLSGFCSAVTGANGRGFFHQRLGRFWALEPGGVDLLRRALVLVADHELNPSTFAARIGAATGASLAASALAGFSTLTGPRHGEASAKALTYLKHAGRDGPNAALAGIAARGETIPATGHALYPKGDPRAVALLKWMKPSKSITEAINAAETASGEPANVDMALAAMTVQFRLPDDAPFLIFASGRMIGWIAHSIEQRISGKPIRPRAQYKAEPYAH